MTSQARSYNAPSEPTIPSAKQKYVPTSGTFPKGFLAGSAHVGVKASNTRFDDLALIASETPCNAAAVFTKNKFQAAPVTVSRDLLKRRNGSGVRGVIINSGCANAVTGKGGLEDAVKMAEETDRCFESEDDGNGIRSLVMSTGVIGQRCVDTNPNVLFYPRSFYFQPTSEKDPSQNPFRVLQLRLFPFPLAQSSPCNLHYRHFP